MKEMRHNVLIVTASATPLLGACTTRGMVGGLLLENVSWLTAVAGVQPSNLLTGIDGQLAQNTKQMCDAVAKSGKLVALLIQCDDNKFFGPLHRPARPQECASYGGEESAGCGHSGVHGQYNAVFFWMCVRSRIGHHESNSETMSIAGLDPLTLVALWLAFSIT